MSEAAVWAMTFHFIDVLFQNGYAVLANSSMQAKYFLHRENGQAALGTLSFAWASFVLLTSFL